MSKTLIDSGTLARLVGIADAMAKLYENGWVRDTGETVFRDARGELDDIIRTADEPVTAAPVVTVQAVPVQQVEALVDAACQRIRTELEGADLTVLDAIASTRADLLAAIK